MSVAHHNGLNPSHKKYRSRTAWGSRTLINKREKRALHQKMRHPQLLLPGIHRTICKNPGTEVHPPAMFIYIMTPQDSPHDWIHALQLDIKAHPDRENRS